MRYDIETTLAGAVTALLGDLVDPAIATLPSADNPPDCIIVDFTDPMSIDDANRVVVMVPTANTSVDVGSEYSARVEVVVKSQWKKPSLKKDYAAHNLRVVEVRDKLMPQDLATRLQAKMPAGAKVNFVSKRRDFSTRVFDTGWIVSEAAFNLTGHFTTEPTTP